MNFKYFLFFWFIVNLIQAYFTPIHYDEAYYYQYAQNLDWGYFDHPPMVALLIKIGGFFFDGELGVRFVGVVLGTASQYLIWRLIDDKKDLFLFVMLSLSMVMINAYAFITTPDTPMLFFALCVLFFYKRFLKSDSYLDAILIGIFAALLLYSKYHGIVLLFFIVLSNLKLLVNKKFYLALVVGLIGFTPHILWQINNEFPSLAFHLVERSQKSNKVWSYVLEYLPNQLLVFSPFIIFFIIRGALIKQKDRFRIALQFIFWGFVGFFFLMCFKGHVEPHWTLIAHPAALILCYYWLLNKNLIWFKRLSYFTIALVFSLKIALAFKAFPQFGFRDMHAWAKQVESISNEDFVVVQDSYKHAALYSFYTHKPAASLHSKMNRKSQYTIWQYEKPYEGKEVTYIDFVSPKENEYKEVNSLMGTTYVFKKKLPF